MVLNALAIDPRRAWKGPWRWFHEQMLDCCQPLSTVIETGINLDQVLLLLTPFNCRPESSCLISLRAARLMECKLSVKLHMPDLDQLHLFCIPGL